MNGSRTRTRTSYGAGVMETVRRLYEESDFLHDFEDDLMAHLETGYVFATRSAILLGRAVMKGAEDGMISDPWCGFDEKECDAWYVWLAVGDLKEIVSFIPYSKKWIAFGRKGTIRYHEFAGLLRTINKTPRL